MLNNITNFFNLLAEKRFKKNLESNDVLSVGTKQSNKRGDYKPTAIRYSDLYNQLKNTLSQNRLEIGDSILASRSLTQEDESKVIPISEAGLVTDIDITLPSQLSSSIAVGSQFMFYLASDSVAVNFVADAGVTILSADSLVGMVTISAVVTAVKVDTNTWLLTGKLA